jgi:hypothetical protein
MADDSPIVTIRKRWHLDAVSRQQGVEMAFGAAGDEPALVTGTDRGLVERLLNAIRFRYISNHTHPTDLLRDEEDNIRQLLFRRLGKSPSFSTGQIEKIRDVAGSLMASIVRELESSPAKISRVELGTPKDWGDLLWAFGLRMQVGESVGREARLHGSGIQATLAYAVLKMLDTSLGSDFGWRRGAIWAVEEPESFLHADLQAQLAESFSRYSNSSRLQILLTTHNNAFLGVANTGVEIQMLDSASVVNLRPREELIGVALASGTMPYAHPLHMGLMRPTLLVEGKNDRTLLERAYRRSGTHCPYEIRSMEDLEATMSGGVEQIHAYLRNNRSALRARPASAPLIVLLDHEVSPGKRDAIQRILDDHSTSACHLMPSDLRTDGLKDDVPGIEAFLALDFFRVAQSQIGLPLVMPAGSAGATWELGVDRAELGPRKHAIHDLLRERDDLSDIAPLIEVLPWVSGLLDGLDQRP